MTKQQKWEIVSKAYNAAGGTIQIELIEKIVDAVLAEVGYMEQMNRIKKARKK